MRYDPGLLLLLFVAVCVYIDVWCSASFCQASFWSPGLVGDMVLSRDLGWRVLSQPPRTYYTGIISYFVNIVSYFVIAGIVWN